MKTFTSEILNDLSFLKLFDFVEDLIFFMEIDGENFRYKYINQAVKNIVSLDDDIIGRTILEVVKDKDEALFLRSQYLKVLVNKESEHFFHRLDTGEGVFIGETTMYPLLDGDRNCRYILSIVKDVTENRQLIKRLEERDALFNVITEHSLDIIKLINPDGIIAYSSPSSKEVVGFSSEDYIGQHFSKFIAPEFRELAIQKFNQILLEKRPLTIELKHLHSSGEAIWQEVVATPIIKYGTVIQVVTSTREITEKVIYREQLSKMAFYDYLSGLPNRRQFDDQLDAALAQAELESKKVALILLDGRQFKHINDSFGHGVGDEVIVRVAQRLKNNIRDIDTAARLGGDEFAIILPQLSDARESMIVIESLMKSFESACEIDGLSIDFRLDMGVAFYPEHAEDKKGLIHCADEALYTTKANNHSNFTVFGQ